MKNLNEEVNKIKHLFNFKKGDVIIESMTKESSDLFYYDSFKKGDKIRYDEGGFTVELTSDVEINEPGNFTCDIKVISSENDEVEIRETGSLNLFDYDNIEGIDDFEIYIGKFTNSGEGVYHKDNIKPDEIEKIN